MGAPRRGFQHDTDVLIRRVDSQLAALRTIPGADVSLAERLASALRALVEATTGASAADRARVRAAVHYFVLRRDARHDRRPLRPLAEDLRVINGTARDLGREDLMVVHDGRLADPP